MHRFMPLFLFCHALSLTALAGVALADEQLLNARCGGCHQAGPDGALSRISEGRRTPEGWDMTLVRMALIHDVPVTPAERRTLVKYLADEYGLAPSESRDWRYILERRPAVIESPPDDQLAAMCARCHSYARVALQRRDADEWRKLSHFHLGQHPTTEYQALARDRNWWEIASTEIPEQLGELYPLQSEAWQSWRAQDKPLPSGDWRLVGHQPGKGRYYGRASISGGDEPDIYNIELELNYADGERLTASGNAILYAGYEWRARLDQGDQTVLQVFALSEDGERLQGRWFYADNDALGGDMTLTRGDRAALLGAEPPYLKTGETATVTLHGSRLPADAEIELGDGVEVIEVLSRGADSVELRVAVDTEAASGPRSVTLGELQSEGLISIYDRIAAVRVEPDYAIARVGGNGGPLAPVPAQFDAIVYGAGADGEGGTDDDLRLGAMSASWSVANANEIAEDMQDKKYAGSMGEDGLFMPAGAGPNPERRYGTNNVGELTVTATVGEGEDAVSGEGKLIVTVQRWNDPPIR